MQKETIKTIAIVILTVLVICFGIWYGINVIRQNSYNQGVIDGTQQTILRQTEMQVYFYVFNNTIQSVPLKDLCGGIK